MLPKIHLSLPSRMSDSRWVITPSWLSGSWRSFLYSSSVYSVNENRTMQIQMVENESESRSVMSDSLQPHWLYSPWNSPGQNTGIGSLSILQGIFPTQDWTQVSRLAGRFFTSSHGNICKSTVVSTSKCYREVNEPGVCGNFPEEMNFNSCERKVKSQWEREIARGASF